MDEKPWAGRGYGSIDEAIYRTLFEDSDLAILYYTPQGTLVSCNRTAARNMGGEPSGFIGRNIADLFPGPGTTLYMNRITESVATDEVREYVDCVPLPVGELWFSSSFKRIPGLDGNGHGVQIVSQDITERKKAEENLQESEERYRLLVTRMKMGLAVHEIVLDSSGVPVDYRFLDVNEGFEQLTGLRRQDILGRTVLEVLPETEPYWIAKYGHVALTGEPMDFEDYSKELDRHFAVTAYSPKRGLFAVLVSDVTRRKHDEIALRTRDDRYHALTQTSMDGFWIVDLTGRILDVNDAYCRMSGYSRDVLLTMHIRDLEVQESPEQVQHHLEVIRALGWERFESKQRRSDGSIYNVQVSTTLLEEQGILLSFLSDITERQTAEQRILTLSYHDELTGLYNRRFYEEELARLDTPRNLPLSLIIGDVNGLKLINDSFGHAQGDQLLRTIAGVMKAECRADDIIARLSGDEFAVLLPTTDPDEVERLVRRIRVRLSRERIGPLELTVALGFASKTRQEENFQDIFKTAEDHMYRTKLYESQSVQNRTISIIMNSLLENNVREQNHSQRVSELCVSIAERMNLGSAGSAQIRLAGLMHDIGKIGVRESLLNKEGKLSEDETAEMRRHSEIGYRILGSVSDFSEICECILQHHEHWDGSGYPRGLKGEEILLPARIIAVADAFDAMTSERTYRRVLSRTDAVQELHRCSGTQFDPAIVQVLTELLETADVSHGTDVEHG